MNRLSVGRSVLLAAMAVALVQTASSLVFANGDSTEIFRGREGAYEIIVGVQPERPVVGSVHFTVTPLDTETSLPVLRAEITLVAHDPQGRPSVQARAVNAPESRRYYDANLTIHSPGEWTVVVEVSTEALGQATFTVPLRVGEAPLSPRIAGTVVWAVVVAILAAGAAYVSYSAGRARRGRSRAG